MLDRPAANKRLALIGKTHREVLSAYLKVIHPAGPPRPPRVVRDPDDNLVIALAACASLVVSGNRDLLELGYFRDFRILNAAVPLPLLSA